MCLGIYSHMVQSAGGLMTMVGGLGLFGSVVFLNSLNFSSPPFPAGFLVGLVAIALGSGMSIGASVIAIREGTGRNLGKPERFMPWAMIALLSAGVCVYGVIEAVNHPLELPECPCPANYYGSYPCLPCPSTFAGVCHGKGTCDDGNTGTGECYCEMGWGGESCSECAPTFQGGQCDECKRGWAGDGATGAIPAMQGQSAIDAMSAGSETDLLGTCAVFVNRAMGRILQLLQLHSTTPSELAGTTTGTRPMYTMPSCARLKGPPARTSTIATPSIVREFVS